MKKEKIFSILNLFIYIALLITGLFFYMMFNLKIQMGCALITLLICSMVLSLKDKYNVLKVVLVGVNVVLLFINMFVINYSLTAIITILLNVSIFILLFLNFKKISLCESCKNVVKITGKILIALHLVGFVFFSTIAINADILSYITQRLNNANVITQVETKIFTTEDGCNVFQDIVYSEEYVNSTYTVYAAENAKATFFYVHGGGFVYGDKDVPLQNGYIFEWKKNGYNVVTINYALSPQSRYGVAIRQINEGLKHFFDNCNIYGINTTNIIIGGDSAGAALSGQLVNILTNEQYANNINIVPANKHNGIKVKGFVSIAGLVDVNRFSDTGNFATDWIYNAWARSYFGINNFKFSSLANQASVLENISENFPPTFISDTSYGSFIEQGKDLANKLEDFGIDVMCNFPPASAGKLMHNWELNVETKVGKENIEKTLSFFDKIINV